MIGFAQQKNYPMAVVAATKNNYIYKILDNPLSIAVTGYYHKDVVVKTSVGKIEYINYNSYYLNVGKCSEKSVMIFVYLKKPKGKLKLIDQSEFKIRDFPKPIIFLGENYGNKFISKSNLDSCFAIYFLLRDPFPNCDIRFNATEFFIKHKHKDGSTSIFKVTKTNLLTEEILESFKKAEDGDTIMLYDVTINGPNGIEKLSDELIFVVKEI